MRSVTNVFLSILTAYVLFAASACKSIGHETWDFIVYLDGDNNLANANLRDLEEMRLGTTSTDIRIFVQFDQPNGIPAVRYQIANNMITELESIGEVDMADGKTLTDFLLWAKSKINQPAQHTVLILSDHGNGWDQTLGPSPSQKIRPRSLFEDYDNNKKRTPALHNHLVRAAIEKANWTFDILGLDASIMGTIEAIHEFSDIAPIVISSQEVGYAEGWNYQRILGQLSNNSAIDNETFATVVVNSYRDDFENDRYPLGIEANDQSYDIAAHRSAFVKQITSAIDSQAKIWIDELNSDQSRTALISKLQTARADAQHIDLYNQPYVYVDLNDLFAKTDNTEIPALLTNATIARYQGKDRPNANGLSIVFFKMPQAWNATYDKNYVNWNATTSVGNKGKFINDTCWDELLSTYYRYAYPSCFDDQGAKSNVASC